MASTATNEPIDLARAILPAGAVATSIAGCRRLVLSPHLDDAVLSLGGVLAHWADAGDAPAVVTICAGRPTAPLTDFARFQHERWGETRDLVGLRRTEDRQALATLGATPVWLELPDCIYRGDRYTTEASIFGPVAADEALLTEAIAIAVATLWATTEQATIYLPLGVGNHVDHRLTVAAGRHLRSQGLPLVEYEDFPYVVRPGGEAQRQELTRGARPEVVPLGAALDQLIAAVTAYASQLPVLFGSEAAMATAISNQAWAVGNGVPATRLWHR